MNRKLFFSTLVALSAVACGDPIKEAQRIEELRVLGARVDIDEAPDRATPAAGESASVEWLLADPSGLPPLAIWHMSVCVAESTAFDVPVCRDEPLTSVEQSEPSSDVPTLSFTVPDAGTLGDATKLAVLAIFCDAGSIELGSDFDSTSCSGAKTTQKASFEIFLASDETSNQNPKLGDAVLEIDGEVLEAGSTSIDCSNDDTPRLPADGQEHQVALVLPPDARETKPPELDVVLAESLQISHMSTLGEFERRFSDVSHDETNLTIDVPWKAPGELDAATPASFYFVVRDDRGGVSWLTRSLCIDP
ncbi:MAG TPA: hypothetical protein VI197_21985 [Polyangiaceae bacterium]